jgi:hypothetical protein
MSITALKTLVESSKATVMVGVLALLGVMLYLRLIDAQQFLDTIKVLVPAWMVAHAGERGAKAIANGKHAPVVAAIEATLEPEDEAKPAVEAKEEAKEEAKPAVEAKEEDEPAVVIDGDKDDKGEAKAPKK